MRRKLRRKKNRRPKLRLGLPDLDQSKSAVLGSLRSPESQRGYRNAIDEFVEWYCSEPRLSLNAPGDKGNRRNRQSKRIQKQVERRLSAAALEGDAASHNPMAFRSSSRDSKRHDRRVIPQSASDRISRIWHFGCDPARSRDPQVEILAIAPIVQRTESAAAVIHQERLRIE